MIEKCADKKCAGYSEEKESHCLNFKIPWADCEDFFKLGEEVCEYKFRVHNGTYTYGCDKKHYLRMGGQKYRYCPFCGKEIRFKEI